MSPPSFRLIAALSVAAVAASGVDGSKSGVMAPQSIADEPSTSNVNVVAKTAALAVDGSGSLVEEKQEQLVRRQESTSHALSRLWNHVTAGGKTEFPPDGGENDPEVGDTVDSHNAYVVSGELSEGGFAIIRTAALASQRSTKSGFKYVCKFALPGESAEETQQREQMLQHEAEVMRELETAQCPGVMRLVETGPIFSCTRTDWQDPSCKEGAEVHLDRAGAGLMMERMDIDLANWNYGARSSGAHVKCGDGIMSKLHTTFAAMHKNGWVHLEVDASNVLLRGKDADGCPTEVLLADFRLAQKVNNKRPCVPTELMNDPAMEIYPRQVFCDRGDHFDVVPAIDHHGLMIIARNLQ